MGSILDRFTLTDHVAVVTGAGRGIGAASAIALAEAGADVVIAARTESQLRVVAERIEAVGRRAVVVPANLAHTAEVAALAQTAYDAFGRLDVVVNNVGGTIPNAFTDTDVSYLEEAFHFNVSTAHALTRAAVPLMLASLGTEAEPRQKSVVSISSALGRLGGRGYLAYGTAKAALAHWTKLAATDLNPRIRVNGIYVGSVLTSALEFVAGVPEMKAQLEEQTPLGTIGEAEDVAAAVLYLASPAGKYLTGKMLEVDGGIQQPNLDLNLPDLAPQPGTVPSPAPSPAAS
ncbi:SDR family oxidoreductase [Nocardioides sp. zg-536]|uniref:SDR family oxidoreductase n=1 Tax=Nocardioides faecalis TaxID=2803858 RepID=A0A939BWG9_9ACTN|nr:SDR family oxidoreductase [Nocardioides faecalis]MBM9461021.1 SDR family oxidoreductase [Nocardioides faecalis]MBS4752073.1 SDR family oxidoreductase [Nocardioides faecalis]QVI59113.1 SDR family oxidoreductase [Nocardioides faecalis]